MAWISQRHARYSRDLRALLYPGPGFLSWAANQMSYFVQASLAKEACYKLSFSIHWSYYLKNCDMIEIDNKRNYSFCAVLFHSLMNNALDSFQWERSHRNQILRWWAFSQHVQSACILRLTETQACLMTEGVGSSLDRNQRIHPKREHK